MYCMLTSCTSKLIRIGRLKIISSLKIAQLSEITFKQGTHPMSEQQFTRKCIPQRREIVDAKIPFTSCRLNNPILKQMDDCTKHAGKLRAREPRAGQRMELNQGVQIRTSHLGEN